MDLLIQFFLNCKIFALSNLHVFKSLYANSIELTGTISKYFLPLFKNMHDTVAFIPRSLGAFTYSEVIIVMGVIGIIATKTIPVLYTDYDRNVTVIKMQKSYSILASGINKSIIDNGTPDSWGISTQGDPTGLSNINAAITPYFNLAQNCNTNQGCFPDTAYKNMKGVENPTILNRDTTYTKARLADGSSMAITQLDENCNYDWGDTEKLKSVCAMVLIDINGDKPPNTLGEDLFGFALTKYGLVPLGTQEQKNGYPFSSFCSLNSNANFKYENGLSCTAWILYKQNMEYLDCQGLNWKNKTACKG